tara:strand:- start:234 stop:485 length:252 start_codon:yes stop_codon:yes gene_type:complete
MTLKTIIQGALAAGIVGVSLLTATPAYSQTPINPWEEHVRRVDENWGRYVKEVDRRWEEQTRKIPKPGNWLYSNRASKKLRPR